jgi:chemotaxis protein MotA
VILAALPFELTTIFGAAFGAFLVNNQMKVVKASVAGVVQCFRGSKYSKARYMELLALLYDILQKARKEGLMSIEKDVEEPDGSPLFQKYPTVGSDRHVTEFITDYLRMMVSGNLNAHEIEALMDSEIDTHHQEAHAPVAAMQRLAGGLPAFGIIAAVLGVVNTMGSVGQPPAVLGQMIGSALVGTFLGILLAYTFAEPLAGLLEQRVEESSKELQCVKSTLLASMQGYAPQTAIEFGRKVLYSPDRPTFVELESHVKGKKK